MVAIIAVLCYSFFVFRGFYRTRGTSLSYSFSVAMLLQVLIPFCFIQNLDMAGNAVLDPEIVAAMSNSHIIYIGISLLFLLIVEKTSTQQLKVLVKTPGQVEIHRNVVFFFVSLSAAQLLSMIVEGKLTALVSQGFTSGESYGVLRVNITEQGYKNYQSSVFNYLKFIFSSGSTFGYVLMLFISATNSEWKKKYGKYLLFIGTVVGLMALATFEKGPVLIFALGSLLVYYGRYLSKLGPLLIIFLFILANALGAFLIFITSGREFNEAISFFYYRIFVEPSVSAYMSFYVFFDSLDWVQFSSFNFIKNAFDLPTRLDTGAIATDAAERFTGQYYSANANLIATGWAQLGYLGVIIYSLIAKVLFTIQDIFVVKSNSTSAIKVLSFFYLFWYLYFANTSIENFVFTSGIFIWPFLLSFLVIPSK